MDYLDKTYKEFAEEGMKGVTQFIGKNDSVENLKNELLALHIDIENFSLEKFQEEIMKENLI